MIAAHLASEAALRLVKPGNETYEVTDTVSKIAEAFKCKVKDSFSSGPSFSFLYLGSMQGYVFFYFEDDKDIYF